MSAASRVRDLTMWAAVAGGLLGCASEEVMHAGAEESESVPALAATVAAPPSSDPDVTAVEGGPLLGVLDFKLTIFAKPERRSDKIGYLRVGSKVTRAKKPAAFDSCQGGFYSILPQGFVCLDDGATLDLEHPLMRANIKPADRAKPLPYSYAFVRAVAPRYYRLPNMKEQLQYEMSLKRHLKSYERRKKSWNEIIVGSNDVELEANGMVLGKPPLEPPDLGFYEKFGGTDGAVPWFFQGGRKIPNVSNFKVPDFVVVTNRIKRHGGVALLDAFEGEKRDFALTTDLRLVPTSKLKPGRGSTFHGVELEDGWELPLAFVKRESAYEYDRKKGRYRSRKTQLVYGMPVQLTGQARGGRKRRFLETEEGTWMRQRDLAVVAKVNKLPSFARKKARWIDISIQRQTLTLYEGKSPIYATMVSTGRDGMDDPKTTYSTPRGTFWIRDKHLTTTMDSQVVGSEFELNDVPRVQYFKAGYALHAAYWHSDFGRPRSHGCVNLSPIDAQRIFEYTSPQLPAGWHSIGASESTSKGTIVHIHP